MRYFVYYGKITEEESLLPYRPRPMTILDLGTRAIHKLGIKKEGRELQTFFKWNPIANDYIFWQDGHVYYSESVESNQAVQITDGGPNMVHGTLDLFHLDKLHGANMESGGHDFEEQGLSWSPKGEKVAIMSHEVNPDEKTVHMTSYFNEQNYAKTVEMRYAKTREVLPKHVISIWDKQTRIIKHMKAQFENETAFCHILHAQWIVMDNKEYLVVVYANRMFTHTSIAVCDYESESCHVVFDYKYPNKTHAEPTNSLVYSNDALYICLPRAMSNGNIYQHIARLTIKISTDITYAQLSFLSLGNFDVHAILGYNAETDIIYFQTMAPKPTNLHLYSTKGSPTNTDEWKCMTCKFESCTYQDHYIHHSFKHIIIFCKGPYPELYFLGEITPDGVENWINLQNENYTAKLAAATLPEVISDTVPLKDGYEALVKIMLPPGRKSSHNFPVLLRVYAGPNEETMANDQWSNEPLWITPLSLGYAIVTIDGRGSTGRGWKYRSAFYGALGTVEIDDQIDGIQKVTEKYPFLDETRITVSGWSYGGYASALITERAPPAFFKCAISVAPVANFLYYHATYSEKHMGNADISVYNANDITNNVQNFEETRLLLVHGLYDDNVHFQHSALFIEALQNNGIDFDLMLYPNQDHMLHRVQGHFLRKLNAFLSSCAELD